MRFKVVGANRQTGARVTMELDGNNRAAAERQANQLGVDVLHVEQLLEGDERPHGSKHRGEFEPESHLARNILLVVLLAVIVLLVVYWDKIRGLWS
jgi:hypothetical protein